jgi:hypothetical protein
MEFDYYIVPERTAWLVEAMRMLRLPERPIFCVREVCGDVFDEVILLDREDNEGFIEHEMRDEVEKFVDSIRESETIGGDIAGTPIEELQRIYVSRSLSTTYRPMYRAIENERDVENRLEKAGFKIVYPETLSFAEQVYTFYNSNVIIGPSGSGMLNSIFSRSNTKVVDIETFHTTIRQHAKIYTSSKLRYSFLFSSAIEESDRPLHRRNSSIDLGCLDRALEWLLL